MARRRFDGAASSAQRLAAHPNVLTIYDWGHADDGRPGGHRPQPPETIDTLLRAHGPSRSSRRFGSACWSRGRWRPPIGPVSSTATCRRPAWCSTRRGTALVADIGLAEFGDFPGFGALHNPIRYFAATGGT